MSQKTPVISSAEDPAQMQAFSRYMEEIQTTPHAVIAARELQRLAPYFDALAELLAEDQREVKKLNAHHPVFLAKAAGRYISNLFNAVAKDTRNIVMSEMLIAPTEVWQEGFPEGTKGSMPEKPYGDGHYNYFFGFKQVFSKNGQGSVSFPVLAFDTEHMSAIASHAETQTLLEEFQRIMTAGNHDVLHHFSNEVLGEEISGVLYDDRSIVMKWAIKYFMQYNDRIEDPCGAESWLMLNHARVRRKLEAGPEGNLLEKSCDRFFDALERIGKDIAATSPEKAHEVVDYFGTMLGFVMMRFMPLDHPLIDHAIARLQAADPAAEKVLDKQADILRKMAVRTPDEKPAYIDSALANYAAEGTTLMPENPDYAALKKMQIFLFAPWMAHLMSTAQPDTELDEARKRLGIANADMMEVVAARNDAFSLADGHHEFTLADGTVVEKEILNREYHSADGAAFKTTSVSADRKHVMKLWYNAEGDIYCRSDDNGFYTQQRWFKDRKLHRDDDLPTEVTTGSDGRREEWHMNNGKLGRKGAPATIIYEPDGSHGEYWYEGEDGKQHRTDGPAFVYINKKGRVTNKRWYMNGKEVRGPSKVRSGLKKLLGFK